MKNTWYLLGLTVLLKPVWAASADFERDVLPILTARCVECHGVNEPKAELRLDSLEAVAAGSLFGAVVTPGDSESSVLVHNVEHRSGARAMPPAGEPLPPDSIATIRAWIDGLDGWPVEVAVWNIGRDHWAYQPLTRPEIPQGDGEPDAHNPIDAFIRAKLQVEGLTPSPEADRRTLIRRLTYNLTGLPPTPSEIDAFLNDERSDAYERLVDRLLASPRYGERWARHWLDVVRYGETHGFDKDHRRNNAWPYRDYVIRSLNGDKPYGQFLREQIAGDVLYPGEPEGVIATGFIVAGAWDQVGQTEVREGTVEKARVRTLDRDDMVSNVFGTFQSATVHCARCHDHKFDPISQTEYFNLQAVFAGVDRGDRSYEDRATAEYRASMTRERDALRAAVDANSTEMASTGEEVLTPYDTQIALLRAAIADQRDTGKASSPGNGWHSTISDRADTPHWVQVDLAGPVDIDRISLVPARPTDYPDTPGFGFPLRFTVSVSGDAAFGDETVVADFSTEDFANPGAEHVEFEVVPGAYRYVRVHATRLWERRNDYVFALAELQVWNGDHNAAAGKPVEASSSIEYGRWSTRFLVDGYDSRVSLVSPNALAERTLAELEEALADWERDRRNAFAKFVDPALVAKLDELEPRLAEVQRTLDALPAAKTVYAAKPVTPRPVHLLRRGEVTAPGPESTPGAIGYLESLGPELEGVRSRDEGSARAALAEWLAHPDNALTWRSIVNRVWHYHFGRGIVDTPNDFGRQGGAPTHPELLDWLAVEFRDGGGSLKDLHRLIVTSAVYRQVSDHDGANARIDASNRFLWRMNRTKLEAEAVRDAVLMVSGKLDVSMGGPSFDLFNYTHDHSPRYDYAPIDNPSSWRRSIYRSIVRSVPDPFFDALDCADPNVSVPVRNETLTALQALALFNDPFVVTQAKYAAERFSEANQELGGQIALAHRWMFGRAADPDEAAWLLEYTEDHGLANTLRLLFNANEFIFID